jgi:hypothetical protein
MDINGNNREYFDGKCLYTGCDVLPGPNVDVALPVHRLPHKDASFDVVMSTGLSGRQTSLRRVRVTLCHRGAGA